MFDIRQTVNNYSHSYSYATEQKPSIACGIDTIYSGIFVANNNINKIDRKKSINFYKIIKFLQKMHLAIIDWIIHNY
jgi:PP-loop superfamily ATP-utilizing enzyme